MCPSQQEKGLELHSVHFDNMIQTEGYNAKVCGVYRIDMPDHLALLPDKEIVKYYSRCERQKKRQELRRAEQALRSKRKKDREDGIRIRRRIRSDNQRKNDLLREARQLRRDRRQSQESAPTPLTDQERMARAAERKKKHIQSLVRRGKKVA
ncbi:MAG: hypothetical protein ACI9VM_000705 [Candidatus Azotimanducaceae bacterium]|jgi:hypothetical protein